MKPDTESIIFGYLAGSVWLHPLQLLSHSALLLVFQANRPPAKLNLLTCQVKRNPDEKKSFDLFSRELHVRLLNIMLTHRVVLLSECVSFPVCFPPSDDRTYHFQAEDEAECQV